MPGNPPDLAVVVALSGRTRAGKTTLAAALRSLFGCPGASFSSFVRRRAGELGLSESRRELQDLGATLVNERGPRRFVEETLRNDGITGHAPFVIEGVRHHRVLKALREVVQPTKVASIYLAVSDHERDRRLAAEGVPQEIGAEWELHSTELEVVSSLKTEADLVLDADLPVDLVANNAVEWLVR